MAGGLGVVGVGPRAVVEVVDQGGEGHGGVGGVPGTTMDGGVEVDVGEGVREGCQRRR